MPVYVKNETIWTQLMPSLLGSAFLLLTLFFNNQTLGVVKQYISPSVQMDRFQSQRAAEVASLERGSELLRKATAVVDQASNHMPREAAICLTARRLSDEALSGAIAPSKDFAVDLDRWNAEARATALYCAYAMRVGGQ